MPTAPFGTLSVLDQLSLVRNQTAIEYDEVRLADDFARVVAAQNALVDGMVADLVEDTTDRLTSYGTGQRMEMQKASEFSRADAQKMRPVTTDIGFPLDRYEISVQWTRAFLEVAPVSDLAMQMQAVVEADTKNVRREIQRALFTPTNRLAYKDRWVDGATLPVRALYNADSAPIPEDDFGNGFDATRHTHYMATAVLTAANIEAAWLNLLEHGVTGTPRIYITPAHEALVQSFANLVPYAPPLVRPGGGYDGYLPTGGPSDPFNPWNRPIGVWNGAVEVWVKPWVLPNYLVVIDLDPRQRVLRRRVRPQTGAGTLRMVVNDEKYPLRAETFQREFGIAVWNRGKAVVLQTNNSVYQTPAIT